MLFDIKIYQRTQFGANECKTIDPIVFIDTIDPIIWDISISRICIDLYFQRTAVMGLVQQTSNGLTQSARERVGIGGAS